ncbi:MAG: replicase [Bramycfau virus 7]|nr:MAG: replicase [Bramycfau virus 7]
MVDDDQGNLSVHRYRTGWELDPVPDLTRPSELVTQSLYCAQHSPEEFDFFFDVDHLIRVGIVPDACPKCLISLDVFESQAIADVVVDFSEYFNAHTANSWVVEEGDVVLRNGGNSHDIDYYIENGIVETDFGRVFTAPCGLGKSKFAPGKLMNKFGFKQVLLLSERVSSTLSTFNWYKAKGLPGVSRFRCRAGGSTLTAGSETGPLCEIMTTAAFVARNKKPAPDVLVILDEAHNPTPNTVAVPQIVPKAQLIIQSASLPQTFARADLTTPLPSEIRLVGQVSYFDFMDAYRNRGSHSGLLILPTIREVEETAAAIQGENPDLKVVVFHRESKYCVADRSPVDLPRLELLSKEDSVVIVATDILQESVTLHVNVVFDKGLRVRPVCNKAEKLSVFKFTDFRSVASQLGPDDVVVPITMADLVQVCGRVGRVSRSSGGLAVVAAKYANFSSFKDVMSLEPVRLRSPRHVRVSSERLVELRKAINAGNNLKAPTRDDMRSFRVLRDYENAAVGDYYSTKVIHQLADRFVDVKPKTLPVVHRAPSITFPSSMVPDFDPSNVPLPPSLPPSPTPNSSVPLPDTTETTLRDSPNKRTRTQARNARKRALRNKAKSELNPNKPGNCHLTLFSKKNWYRLRHIVIPTVEALSTLRPYFKSSKALECVDFKVGKLVLHTYIDPALAGRALFPLIWEKARLEYGNMYVGFDPDDDFTKMPFHECGWLQHLPAFLREDAWLYFGDSAPEHAELMSWLRIIKESEPEPEPPHLEEVPVRVKGPGDCWKKCFWLTDDGPYKTVQQVLQETEACARYLSPVFIRISKMEDGDYHIDDVFWEKNTVDESGLVVERENIQGLHYRDGAMILRDKIPFVEKRLYMKIPKFLGYLRDIDPVIQRFVGSGTSALDETMESLSSMTYVEAFESQIAVRINEELGRVTNICPWHIPEEARPIAVRLGIPWSKKMVKPHTHPIHAAMRRLLHWEIMPRFLTMDTTVFFAKQNIFDKMADLCAKANDVQLTLHNAIVEPRDISRYACDSVSDINPLALDVMKTRMAFFSECGHFFSPLDVLKVFKHNPSLEYAYFSCIIPSEMLVCDYTLEPDFYRFSITESGRLLYAPEKDVELPYDQPATCAWWLQTHKITGPDFTLVMQKVEHKGPFCVFLVTSVPLNVPKVSAIFATHQLIMPKTSRSPPLTAPVPLVLYRSMYLYGKSLNNCKKRDLYAKARTHSGVLDGDGLPLHVVDHLVVVVKNLIEADLCDETDTRFYKSLFGLIKYHTYGSIRNLLVGRLQRKYVRRFYEALNDHKATGVLHLRQITVNSYDGEPNALFGEPAFMDEFVKRGLWDRFLDRCFKNSRLPTSMNLPAYYPADSMRWRQGSHDSKSLYLGASRAVLKALANHPVDIRTLEPCCDKEPVEYVPDPEEEVTLSDCDIEDLKVNTAYNKTTRKIGDDFKDLPKTNVDKKVHWDLPETEPPTPDPDPAPDEVFPVLNLIHPVSRPSHKPVPDYIGLDQSTEFHKKQISILSNVADLGSRELVTDDSTFKVVEPLAKRMHNAIRWWHLSDMSNDLVSKNIWANAPRVLEDVKSWSKECPSLPRVVATAREWCKIYGTAFVDDMELWLHDTTAMIGIADEAFVAYKSHEQQYIHQPVEEREAEKQAVDLQDYYESLTKLIDEVKGEEPPPVTQTVLDHCGIEEALGCPFHTGVEFAASQNMCASGFPWTGRDGGKCHACSMMIKPTQEQLRKIDWAEADSGLSDFTFGPVFAACMEGALRDKAARLNTFIKEEFDPDLDRMQMTYTKPQGLHRKVWDYIDGIRDREKEVYNANDQIQIPFIGKSVFIGKGTAMSLVTDYVWPHSAQRRWNNSFLRSTPFVFKPVQNVTSEDCLLRAISSISNSSVRFLWAILHQYCTKETVESLTVKDSLLSFYALEILALSLRLNLHVNHSLKLWPRNFGVRYGAPAHLGYDSDRQHFYLQEGKPKPRPWEPVLSIQHTRAADLIVAAVKERYTLKPYSIDCKRAEGYARALRFRTTGTIGPGKGVSEEQLKAWEETAVKTNRSVNLTFVAGNPGCGKSYPMKQMLRKPEHKQGFSYSVAVPTVKLRDEWAASLDLQSKVWGGRSVPSNFLQTFENIILKSNPEVLVVDEISKYPPGWLDLVLAIKPFITTVVLLGDAEQCTWHEPNSDCQLNDAMTYPASADYLVPWISEYQVGTRRLCIFIATMFNIPTTSKDDTSRIYFSDSTVSDWPIVVVSGNMVNRVSAVSPGTVVTGNSSQGCDWNCPYQLVISSPMLTYLDRRLLWTCVTRGSKDLYIVWDFKWNDKNRLLVQKDPLLNTLYRYYASGCDPKYSKTDFDQFQYVGNFTAAVHSKRSLCAPIEEFTNLHLIDTTKVYLGHNDDVMSMAEMHAQGIITIPSPKGGSRAETIFRATKVGAEDNVDALTYYSLVDPVPMQHENVREPEVVDPEIREHTLRAELETLAERSDGRLRDKFVRELQLGDLFSDQIEDLPLKKHNAHLVSSSIPSDVLQTDAIDDRTLTDPRFLQPAHHMKTSDKVARKAAIKKRLRFVKPGQNEKEFIEASEFVGPALWESLCQMMPKLRFKQPWDPALFEACELENEKNRFDVKSKDFLVAMKKRASPEWGAQWVQKPAEYWDLSFKQEWKAKSETLWQDAKALQTLVTMHESVFQSLGGIARYITKKVLSLCPGNLVLYLGLSPDDLNEIVKERWRDVTSQTNDFTAFDSGQDASFLYIEIELMKALSIPKHHIEEYRKLKMSAITKYGHIAILRFTGELFTFVFNSLANIAITNLRFHLSMTSGPRFLSLFGGDDSAINGVMRERSTWKQFEPHIRLKFKREVTKRPNFVGWILSSKGIIKNPTLLWYRWRLKKELGKLPEVLLSYAYELSFAMRHPDLFSYLTEEELEAHGQIVTQYYRRSNFMAAFSNLLYRGTDKMKIYYKNEVLDPMVEQWRNTRLWGRRSDHDLALASIDNGKFKYLVYGSQGIKPQGLSIWNKLLQDTPNDEGPTQDGFSLLETTTQELQDDEPDAI